MTGIAGNFLELLDIDPEERPVIAVVGGGGKTSLIFRLARELVAGKKSVIVTTTTHMARDPAQPFALDGEEETVRSNLLRYGYTVAADFEKESGKLCSLSEEGFLKLREWCHVLLVEADGSRGLPIKAPEAWEPVIPSVAELVIGVAGLDCLGRPLGETAHRPELLSGLLGKKPEALVTPEDVAKLAASARGMRKNVGNRAYRVYLNKADVLPDLAPAREIVDRLTEKKITAAWGIIKSRKGTSEWISR